jgi:hypothetical protein
MPHGLPARNQPTVYKTQGFHVAFFRVEPWLVEVSQQHIRKSASKKPERDVMRCVPWLPRLDDAPFMISEFSSGI